MKMRIHLYLGSLFFISVYFILWFTAHYPYGHFDIDSYGYHAIAQQFVNTGQLRAASNFEYAPIQPVGYSFFIGLLYKIGGINIAFVLFVQVLLALLSGLLLCTAMWCLFDKNCATITFYLYVSCVGLWVYPQFLLAESVLLFLFILFLERFIAYSQSQNVWNLLLAAFVLGISVPVKSVTLPYFFVLLPFVFTVTQGSLLCKLYNVFLFFVGFYTPVCLYQLRNLWLYDVFAIAPLKRLNIYHVFFSKVLAKLTGKSPHLFMQNQLRFTATNPFDATGWESARVLFWEYVPKHWPTFVFVWVKNMCKTILGLYSSQLKILYNPNGIIGSNSFFTGSGTVLQKIYIYVFGNTNYLVLKIIAGYEVAWSVLRWLLCAVGGVYLFKQKEYFWFLFVTVSVFMFVVITGFDGCARYRLICEPFLIMFAAVGIQQFLRPFDTFYLAYARRTLRTNGKTEHTNSLNEVESNEM